MNITLHGKSGRCSVRAATLLFFPLHAHVSPFILYGRGVHANPVHINTASVKELATLPFIGSNRAKAIQTYRQEHGPFQSLAELQKVDGIGEKSLTAITPLIRLGTTISSSPPPGDQETSAIRSGQIMLLPDQAYYPMLIHFLRNAEHRIDMAMYIFKKGSSNKNRAQQVAQELIQAQKRGVKVRVILDESDWNDSVNKANRHVARYLQQNKVMVRFDSHSTTTHSKIVIIDQRFCFVGSHNMTHTALSKNNEMSILLDSPKVAKQMQHYIERIH